MNIKLYQNLVKLGYDRALQYLESKNKVQHLALDAPLAYGYGGAQYPLDSNEVKDHLNYITFRGISVGSPDSRFTWTDIRRTYNRNTLVGGWGFTEVGKAGTNNGGRLIAVPRSADAQAIVAARLYYAARRLGGDHFLAGKLAANSRGIRYVNEEGVILAFLELAGALREGGSHLIMPAERRRAWWERVFGTSVGLSHWRLESVGQVAKRAFPTLFDMEVIEELCE